MENYRPISLCNILYKLIFKVVANRLKGVLFTLIFNSQSAFVPEGQITDTIMATYEIIQAFRTRKKGKKGFMSIKLDMSKVYCRVEWDYLERILLVRGFHSQLIHLIIQCVKTTSFPILVNSSPKGPIVPCNGLRQRNPFSPYLFLLCTEGLVSLLKESALDNSLE